MLHRLAPCRSPKCASRAVLRGSTTFWTAAFPRITCTCWKAIPALARQRLRYNSCWKAKHLGEGRLYVTLSESKMGVLQEVAKSHGWSLDGISIVEMTPQEEMINPEANAQSCRTTLSREL